VVAVAVCAERVEGDHDLRAQASELRDDTTGRLSRLRLVECPIHVVQELDLAHAKFSRRRPELRLADSSHLGVAGATLVREIAPPLAARGRDDVRLDPLRRIRRQRPADAERLVIGMSQDSHEPQRFGSIQRHRAAAAGMAARMTAR
jgi:hypothetical protein